MRLRHWTMWAAVIIGGSSSLALAESISVEPSRQEFKSPNGRNRLQILPLGESLAGGKQLRFQKREIGGGTQYLSGRVTTRVTVLTDPGGAARTVSIETGPPESTMSRVLRLFDSTGEAPVWEALIDYVPDDAVVSDSGRFVALFDEWNKVGRSPHVVVLYGPGGHLLRSYRLEDLLSTTAPSLSFRLMGRAWHGQWAGRAGHAFDAAEKHLVISLALEELPPMFEHPPSRQKRIELGTGMVVP